MYRLMKDIYKEDMGLTLLIAMLTPLAAFQSTDHHPLLKQNTDPSTVSLCPSSLRKLTLIDQIEEGTETRPAAIFNAVVVRLLYSAIFAFITWARFRIMKAFIYGDLFLVSQNEEPCRINNADGERDGGISAELIWHSFRTVVDCVSKFMDILYQIGYIALVFRSGGMHIFALMYRNDIISSNSVNYVLQGTSLR
ncbi:hypothetical protein B0H14DRAFT_3762160 [Mycena olivaceomarginata]|nr:hypothetical protein B0H14DRAFT_3762160 [Mycena olivaceomarginata]